VNLRNAEGGPDDRLPKSPPTKRTPRILQASGDGQIKRLGTSEDFKTIVLFLAERAPEPWASQLYRIALTGKRAA
jgi:hypothetical protein